MQALRLSRVGDKLTFSGCSWSTAQLCAGHGNVAKDRQCQASCVLRCPVSRPQGKRVVFRKLPKRNLRSADRKRQSNLGGRNFEPLRRTHGPGDDNSIRRSVAALGALIGLTVPTSSISLPGQEQPTFTICHTGGGQNCVGQHPMVATRISMLRLARHC